MIIERVSVGCIRATESKLASKLSDDKRWSIRGTGNADQQQHSLEDDGKSFDLLT